MSWSRVGGSGWDDRGGVARTREVHRSRYEFLGLYPKETMTRKDPELERLIDSIAEQDCDTEEDVAMGLCYAIQEHVRFPIPGKVIGEAVTVLEVEESHGLEVIAICERNGRKYRVRLQDIELTKRVAGGQWIDAYRQFRGRDGLPPTGLIR